MVILKCLILYGCRSRNNPKYSFPYSFEISLCFFLLLLIFTIIYRSRFQKCIFETYGRVCIKRTYRILEYQSLEHHATGLSSTVVVLCSISLKELIEPSLIQSPKGCRSSFNTYMITFWQSSFKRDTFLDPLPPSLNKNNNVLLKMFLAKKYKDEISNTIIIFHIDFNLNLTSSIFFQSLLTF